MFPKLIASGALLVAMLGGAAPGIAADQQQLIQVDGSSTVYPITEAMAEEFQKSKGGKIQVTVGISGTGGGMKKFCRGETDISDASRPIKESERSQCRDNEVQFIEIPIAIDALTVVVSPQNTWVDKLTVEELKKMWAPEAQGKVNSWSQIRSGFPDKPLKLFGPGTDSGTYDYFTEAVVGKEHSSRGDYTASEDDNVLVAGVANDGGALGFFGYAYYKENASRLKAVPISYKGGAAVMPSPEAAKDASYKPLSRPLFIYVSKKAADTKPYVREFVEYYLNASTAKPLITETGYVPLPDEAYVTGLQHFKDRVLGTAFRGPQIGLTVQEILAKEKTL